MNLSAIFHNQFVGENISLQTDHLKANHKQQIICSICAIKKKMGLFYSHRLRQISGLVHVAATHHSNVIRKQLQWNNREEWHQHVIAFRNFNYMVGQVVDDYHLLQ